jgi:malate dehydrogenase (quinone)
VNSITPESADGSIDPKKRLNIAESFEISRQFWAYLVETRFRLLKLYKKYSHMSFVWGDKMLNVQKTI